MNGFDTSILAFLSESTHRFLIIDKFMMTVVNCQLLKGGIVLAVIWGLWFRTADDLRKKELTRERVTSTFVACLFSLFITRILVFLLPFRTRPLYNPEIHLVVPPGWLETWNASHFGGFSSFPSDHAALFLTLAAGIYFIDRYLGIVISLYALVVICFPRIYLGLHYPTDILAGALLGVAVSLVFNSDRIRSRVTKPFMCAMKKAPGLFYACSFLVTFEMGNLFWDIRALAVKADKILSFFL